MFISSMKYTRRLEPGGPKRTPLFFSSGPSRMSCKLGASLNEFMLTVS